MIIDRLKENRSFSRKKRARNLTILLMILAMLCLVGTAAYAKDEKTPFVLLVYMTGSDLESRGQNASKDLREMMENIPKTGIRILVQTGGSNSWGEEIDPEKSTRLEVRSGTWERLEEMSDLNMGDPDTLRDFLNWGCEYAPAKKYGLILWNHGGGPLVGVCLDERHQDESGAEDSLSLPEMKSALSESSFAKNKLEWIGFDACLMGSLEVANVVSPYARYMIASQELEPEEGWSYDFLREMTGGEGGAEWGERIIAAFVRSQNQNPNVTMTCLDLAQLDRVRDEIASLFGSLKEKVDAESYSELTRCRMNSRSFGHSGSGNTEFDLIDLIDLVNTYDREGQADGQALKEALNVMIIHTWPENDRHVHGVCVYYPFDNKSHYVSPWGSRYQELSISSEYGEFIQRISDYYLGDALFNRNSDYQLDLYDENGRVRLESRITEEEAKNLGRARLFVLEKLASDSYKLVYYNDQSIRATDRAVSARYGGEALYIVGKDGKILDGPLSYFPYDDGVAIYCLMYSGFHSETARLVYQKNETGELILSQVLMSNKGADGLFLPAAIDPKDFDQLEILSFGPQNVINGETITSLNFSVYFPGGTVLVDPKDPDWHLEMIPEWNRNERVAYLRMTDTRGETYFSELKHLTSYNLIPVTQNEVYQEFRNIQILAKKGDLVTGHDAGLRFSILFRNSGKEDIRVDAAKIRLENKETTQNIHSYEITLAADEEDEMEVFLPMIAIKGMELPETVLEAEIFFTVREREGESEEVSIRIPMTLKTSMFRE